MLDANAIKNSKVFITRNTNSLRVVFNTFWILPDTLTLVQLISRLTFYTRDRRLVISFTKLNNTLISTNLRWKFALIASSLGIFCTAINYARTTRKYKWSFAWRAKSIWIIYTSGNLLNTFLPACCENIARSTSFANLSKTWILIEWACWIINLTNSGLSMIAYNALRTSNTLCWKNFTIFVINYTNPIEDLISSCALFALSITITDTIFNYFSTNSLCV